MDNLSNAEFNTIKQELQDLSSKAVLYNSETDYFGIYINGEWKDVLFAGLNRHWLYNKGNEFTALTGGWDDTGYANHSTCIRSGIVTKYSEYIDFKITGSSRCSIVVGTNNPVDLEPYKEIVFTYINPTTLVDFQKTLDISSISTGYIMCGLDYTMNGLETAVTSTRSYLEIYSVVSTIDSGYAGYGNMYLKSVELIPL